MIFHPIYIIHSNGVRNKREVFRNWSVRLNLLWTGRIVSRYGDSKFYTDRGRIEDIQYKIYKLDLCYFILLIIFDDHPRDYLAESKKEGIK